MRTSLSLLLIAAFLLPLSTAPAQAQAPVPTPVADPIRYVPADRNAYMRYAQAAESMLQSDILGQWYPRSMDAVNGGFRSDFARDWSPLPSHGKFSVFQGRMTWVAAQVVLHRPAQRAQYLPYVRHGADYLRDVLWDKQYGGFFWGLADDGSIAPGFSDNKHMYGISFALYGLAAAFQATHDDADLRRAQEAFHWIEAHAHDDRNGGYFEWLTRAGVPMQAKPYAAVVESVQGSGFPIGYKSMNTHIHLLESLTELLRVWPDPLLRTRVRELEHLVRDVITVQPGAMNQFFTNDWHAVPDLDSYGHDAEVTYLLDETASVLQQAGAPLPDAEQEQTRRVGRMLMDHALAYGWDRAHGGLFQNGSFNGPPADRNKEWWVQAESLNTLLLLHERFGSTTDVYWKAFQLQWQWIRNHQVDSVYGGEYNIVTPDGTPRTSTKGEIWKAAYHEARALMNVHERLERLAASSQ